VREARDLLLHGGHHAGGGVADPGDGDARAQVDERVAVGVDDDTTAGGHGEHGHGSADAARDGILPALQPLTGGGAGDGGGEAALLGKRGAAHDGEARLVDEGHECLLRWFMSRTTLLATPSGYGSAARFHMDASYSNAVLSRRRV
jgi:hypothetical protein